MLTEAQYESLPCLRLVIGYTKFFKLASNLAKFLQIGLVISQSNQSSFVYIKVKLTAIKVSTSVPYLGRLGNLLSRYVA